MRVVDAADLLVGRLCPYVAGGIGVGSLYWTCVTFGAVTVMQVGATTNKTRVLLNNLQAISDMLDSLWKVVQILWLPVLPYCWQQFSFLWIVGIFVCC